MEILVPISICAIMPIAIVLIVSLVRVNNDNKRSEILIKAIEANNNIDADSLAEALKKPRKTPRELLNQRLLRGCIFTISGLVVMITFLLPFFSDDVYVNEAVLFFIVVGGLSLAIGISYLIVYFVTRKQVDGNSDR